MVRPLFFFLSRPSLSQAGWGKPPSSTKRTSNAAGEVWSDFENVAERTGDDMKFNCTGLAAFGRSPWDDNGHCANRGNTHEGAICNWDFMYVRGSNHVCNVGVGKPFTKDPAPGHWDKHCYCQSLGCLDGFKIKWNEDPTVPLECKPIPCRDIEAEEQNCHGHGTSLDLDSSDGCDATLCACDDGFEGLGCSKKESETPSPTPPSPTPSPPPLCRRELDCSGHGTPLEPFTPPCNCKCDVASAGPWTGDDCENTPVCDATTHCNGHGQPVDMYAIDRCECDCERPHTGRFCDKFVCSCTNGIPREDCGTETEHFCDRCNDGFSFQDGHCKTDCLCSNGYKDPHGCDRPGETRCIHCEVGFHLEENTNQCVPAPCNLPNTNLLPGLACACDNAHEGQVVWIGSTPIASCTPKCTCINGIASERGCDLVGEEKCMSCNHDFYMINQLCRTECECENGKSAKDCTHPHEERCERCDPGFQLEGHSCVPSCLCPHGTPLHSGCDTRQQVLCTSCNDGYFLTEDHQCRAPCQCDDGDAAASCEHDGDARCESCFSAFSLEDETCVPASCELPGTNGMPGPHCQCKHGHQGRVSWLEDKPMSTCTPQCKCLKGVANPAGCQTVGEISCLTCDEGYELRSDGHCMADCTCANGVPAKGCESRTEQKCARCHDGYLQDGDVCFAAPCNVSGSNMLPGSECACLPLYEGDIAWSGAVHFGSCVPQCQCNNGQPGTGCEVGQTFCMTCNNGYHLLDERCLPQCKCPNGQTDVMGCLSPNQTLCETCDSGYTRHNGQCHPSCSCPNGQTDTVCDSINETKCIACDDGFSLRGGKCHPAECDAPYSKKTSANVCECDLLQGMDGVLRWHGDKLVGSCQAVNCQVEGPRLGVAVPLAGSGPNCSCAPGYTGKVQLDKEAGHLKILTDCKQVPCMPFAELVDGTCRCKRGYAGENIMWNHSSWAGQCQLVECSVDHASRDCQCEDGYHSEHDLWSHDAQNWMGECTAVNCDVEFSTHRPGADCMCRPGFHGRIDFHGQQAMGFCHAGLHPLLRETVSLPAGTLCSFTFMAAAITMLSRAVQKQHL